MGQKQKQGEPLGGYGAIIQIGDDGALSQVDICGSWLNSGSIFEDRPDRVVCKETKIKVKDNFKDFWLEQQESWRCHSLS